MYVELKINFTINLHCANRDERNKNPKIVRDCSFNQLFICPCTGLMINTALIYSECFPTDMPSALGLSNLFRDWVMDHEDCAVRAYGASSFRVIYSWGRIFVRKSRLLLLVRCSHPPHTVSTCKHGEYRVPTLQKMM